MGEGGGRRKGEETWAKDVYGERREGGREEEEDRENEGISVRGAYGKDVRKKRGEERRG